MAAGRLNWLDSKMHQYDKVGFDEMYPHTKILLFYGDNSWYVVSILLDVLQKYICWILHFLPD